MSNTHYAPFGRQDDAAAMLRVLADRVGRGDPLTAADLARLEALLDDLEVPSVREMTGALRNLAQCWENHRQRPGDASTANLPGATQRVRRITDGLRRRSGSQAGDHAA